MTSEQTMLQSQLKRHPMTAPELAHLVGWPIEVVYTDLVAMEAQNKVRVVIRYIGKRVESKEWEAM